MAGIYPSLQEKFKNEGICPICMMTLSMKYSCMNDHIMCHRCKPYYYVCPICRSPLDIEIPPPEEGEYHMPPPMHYMPHPYPPYPPGRNPSAPFIEHESHSWAPPTPTEDQELAHCGFCFAGCEAKFPEHLRHIHESRCQFRPNLENEPIPTDLTHDEETLLDCRYSHVGCNVRLPEWRKAIHEPICIYKDRIHQAVDGIAHCLDEFSFEDRTAECDYDPEEMVDCRYNEYGCTVRMPRRRKNTHEQKCNWAKHRDQCEEEYCYVPEENPDENVPCIWAKYGCQVTPRRCRRETHAEKCNYRMERCTYSSNGCGATFQISQRFAHEKNCEYA